MSKTAQKFLEEIEAPLKHSKDREKSVKCLYNCPKHNSPCRAENRVYRNVCEKPRPFKWVPQAKSSPSRMLQHKCEGRTLKKSFTDIAVNTQTVGPLHPLPKSDNNCVTLVRKRIKANKCICKEPPKRLTVNASTEQVHVSGSKAHSCLDKACYNAVETVNHSTQCLEILIYKPETQKQVIGNREIGLIDVFHTEMLNQSLMQSNLKHLDEYQRDCLRPADMQQAYLRQLDLRQQESRPLDLMQSDWKYQDIGQSNSRQADLEQRECSEDMKRIFTKIPSTNYMGARRWALSQYPIRGPDF